MPLSECTSSASVSVGCGTLELYWYEAAPWRYRRTLERIVRILVEVSELLLAVPITTWEVRKGANFCAAIFCYKHVHLVYSERSTFRAVVRTRSTFIRASNVFGAALIVHLEGRPEEMAAQWRSHEVTTAVGARRQGNYAHWI